MKLPGAVVAFFLMLLGCAQEPDRSYVPGSASFQKFVDVATRRAKERQSSSEKLTLQFEKYEQTQQGARFGTISLRVETPWTDEEGPIPHPSKHIVDYELTFALQDDKWKFRNGVARHRTGVTIVSPEKSDSTHGKRTEKVDALEKNELLFALFYVLKY